MHPFVQDLIARDLEPLVAVVVERFTVFVAVLSALAILTAAVTLLLELLAARHETAAAKPGPRRRLSQRRSAGHGRVSGASTTPVQIRLATRSLAQVLLRHSRW